MIDEAKLHELVGRMLDDLGGAMSISLVRMGDSLGLYKALHAKGPLTPAALARETGTAERYIREWLSAQAAAGYVAFDEAAGTFSLPPEQAMVFANEDSPVFLMGAFDAAVAMVDGQSKVEAAFKTGGGVHWGTRPPAASARQPASSARAIAQTWSTTGCPRSRGLSESSGPAQRWPTSAAVMD